MDDYEKRTKKLKKIRHIVSERSLMYQRFFEEYDFFSKFVYRKWGGEGKKFKKNPLHNFRTFAKRPTFKINDETLREYFIADLRFNYFWTHQ